MRVRLLLSNKVRLFSEETSEDRQGTEMAFSAFPLLKIMVHVVVVFQSASKLKDSHDQVNPCTFVPTDFQLYRKMKLKFYFRFSVFVFLAEKKRN